jgi:hypothetical protein
MDYSRTYRFDFFDDGSGDCSSVQAAAFLYAGFPLKKDGKELLTSSKQVYAEGFDLIWPNKFSDIGKKMAPSDLVYKYGAQPGDLVFDNWDEDTSRSNKITHIRRVYDAKNFIHTANNREKLCKVPFSWGKSHIVAIIRLKPDVKLIVPKELEYGDNGIHVRRMQIALNIAGLNPELRCDGNFGPKTKTALNNYKGLVGLRQDAVCDEETWDALYGAPKKYVQILGGSVNVRTVGNRDGKVIGVAKKGERYEYIERATTGWYKIKFKKQVGYISNRDDLTKIVK